MHFAMKKEAVCAYPVLDSECFLSKNSAGQVPAAMV
jgi:hypothetical protein